MYDFHSLIGVISDIHPGRMNRSPHTYSPEAKRKALDRYYEVCTHMRPYAAYAIAAKRIGCSPVTVRLWVQAKEKEEEEEKEKEKKVIDIYGNGVNPIDDEVSKLQLEVEISRNDADALDAKVNELQREKDELQAEKEKLRMEKEALLMDVDDMQQRISSESDETPPVTSDPPEDPVLKLKLQKLRKKVGKLEGKNTALKQMMARLLQEA